MFVSNAHRGLRRRKWRFGSPRPPFVLSSAAPFGAVSLSMTHLASFLDKFEEHFGSGWTRALLVLIGLAGVSACGLVLWFALLGPLLETILGAGSSPSTRAEEVAKVIAFLMIAMLGLGFGAAVAAKYLESAIKAHLLQQVRDAKRAVVESEKQLAFAEAKLAMSEHRTATAEDCLEHVLAKALESKMLTQGQIRKLRRSAAEHQARGTS